MPTPASRQRHMLQTANGGGHQVRPNALHETAHLDACQRGDGGLQQHRVGAGIRRTKRYGRLQA